MSYVPILVLFSHKNLFHRFISSPSLSHCHCNCKQSPWRSRSPFPSSSAFLPWLAQALATRLSNMTTLRRTLKLKLGTASWARAAREIAALMLTKLRRTLKLKLGNAPWEDRIKIMSKERKMWFRLKVKLHYTTVSHSECLWCNWLPCQRWPLLSAEA